MADAGSGDNKLSVTQMAQVAAFEGRKQTIIEKTEESVKIAELDNLMQEVAEYQRDLLKASPDDKGSDYHEELVRTTKLKKELERELKKKREKAEKEAEELQEAIIDAASEKEDNSKSKPRAREFDIERDGIVTIAEPVAVAAKDFSEDYTSSPIYAKAMAYKQATRNAYYAALGIEPDADDATRRKAFFKAARKYHPDRLGGSTERMQFINEANEAIGTLEAEVRWEEDAKVQAAVAVKRGYVLPPEGLDFVADPRPATYASRKTELPNKWHLIQLQSHGGDLAKHRVGIWCPGLEGTKASDDVAVISDINRADAAKAHIMCDPAARMIVSERHDKETLDKMTSVVAKTEAPVVLITSHELPEVRMQQLGQLAERGVRVAPAGLSSKEEHHYQASWNAHQPTPLDASVQPEPAPTQPAPKG